MIIGGKVKLIKKRSKYAYFLSASEKRKDEVRYWKDAENNTF